MELVVELFIIGFITIINKNKCSGNITENIIESIEDYLNNI